MGLAAAFLVACDGTPTGAQRPDTETPPDPTASFNVSISSVFFGTFGYVTSWPISMDGSGSSHPDGAALEYVWSFGDGESATGAQVEHAYAAPGTYPVTLTVRTAGGQQGTMSTSLTVGRSIHDSLIGHLVPGLSAQGLQVVLAALFANPVQFDALGSKDGTFTMESVTVGAVDFLPPFDSYPAFEDRMTLAAHLESLTLSGRIKVSILPSEDVTITLTNVDVTSDLRWELRPGGTVAIASADHGVVFGDVNVQGSGVVNTILGAIDAFITTLLADSLSNYLDAALAVWSYQP